MSTTRKETERTKFIQDKCQTLLTQMLRDEDNKYCVDCDAKGECPSVHLLAVGVVQQLLFFFMYLIFSNVGPRWASWNLGVFLCIRCAGIHRNLGVHISRVKSVNLDSWTPEQVVSLQNMGNSRARAVYEAQLPDGFRRPQTDSALESFIRAKYEHKKYVAREWVPPAPVKANWDKEVDEEMERQKRKKKSSTTTSATSSGSLTLSNEKKSSISVKSPIPAPLPKPHGTSSSPKSSRSVVSVAAAATAPQPATNNSASLDLLGLCSPTSSNGPNNGKQQQDDLSGGDVFSNFLSAPPAPTNISSSNTATGTSVTDALANAIPADSLAKQEQDFFNQVLPNEKEKAKMTKDSILALYGTAPTTPSIGQFNGGGFNNFNNSGFATQQQQQSFNAIPPTSVQQQQQFSNVHLLSQLGASPMSATHPPSNQNFMQSSAPFGSFGFGGGPPPPPQQQQVHQQQSFAQFPPMAVGGGGGGGVNFSVAAQPQPFGMQPGGASATATNMNQQFGNLNLGNVWQ